MSARETEAQLIALGRRIRAADLANLLAPSDEVDEMRAEYRRLHARWMADAREEAT